MHFILMLAFLFVWLLVLLIGSIALQRTGMERSKAHFQALSAITGSGFTTSEAESVVNNTKRRSIISWLMFIGNAGTMLFVIAVILYVKAAIVTPSVFEAAVIAVSILLVILLIRFGIVDRLSEIVVGGARTRGAATSGTPCVEVLLQLRDHAVARITSGEKSGLPGSTLKSSGLIDKGLIILAIERGSSVIQQPRLDLAVQPGDCLICYGSLTAVNADLASPD